MLTSRNTVIMNQFWERIYTPTSSDLKSVDASIENNVILAAPFCSIQHQKFCCIALMPVCSLRKGSDGNCNLCIISFTIRTAKEPVVSWSFRQVNCKIFNFQFRRWRTDNICWRCCTDWDWIRHNPRNMKRKWDCTACWDFILRWAVFDSW